MTFRPDDEIIALPVTVEQIGENEAVIRTSAPSGCSNHRNTSSLLRVPAAVAALCREADEFRTVAGHVAHAHSIGWPASESSMITDWMRTLLDAGLLTTSRELLKSIRSRSTDSHSHGLTPVRAMAWITCERPELLARSLHGFIQNSLNYGRETRFSVFDDSVDPSRVGEGRRATQRISAETGADISWVGREQRRKFAADLARSGLGNSIPSRIIEWSLLGTPQIGPTIGANRNSALLMNPRTPLICADDDSLCRVCRTGDSPSGIALSSAYLAMESFGYPDRSMMLRSTDPVQLDVIGLHESLLGRSVSDCLQDLARDDRDVDVQRMSPRFVQSLLSNDGSVRITGTGVAGDSGIGSSKFVLTMEGDERDRFVSDADAYALAKVSREVFRAARTHTISEGFFVGGFHLGLDLRGFLPPFIPIGRNEDVLFAGLLRTCDPDASIGHIPWAIGHEPAENRRFKPDSLFDVMPRINDLVGAQIANASSRTASANTPEARLFAIGAALEAAARRPDTEFRDGVIGTWCTHARHAIGKMQIFLERYAWQPDHWAADVEQFITVLTGLVERPDLIVPADAPPAGNQGVAAVQEVSLKYGELLQAWPQIVDAARQAGQEDGGLAGSYGSD